MNKKQRQEVVARFSQKIAAAKGGVLVDFQGLNVEAANALRRQVRGVGSELTVTKNTLLRIASQQTDFAGLNDTFAGPTAVAFFKDDPIPLVKVVSKFIKDNPVLAIKIKGGLLNKKILNAKEIEQLAELPSREVLIGQLFGLLTAPTRNLVTVLGEVPRKLLRVLQALCEKKNQ